MRLHGLPALIIIRNLAAAQILGGVCWIAIFVTAVTRPDLFEPSFFALAFLVVLGVGGAWIGATWWALVDETLLRHDITRRDWFDQVLPAWALVGALTATFVVLGISSFAHYAIDAWIKAASFLPALVFQCIAMASAASILKQSLYNIRRRQFFLGNWTGALMQLSATEAPETLARLQTFVASQSGRLAPLLPNIAAHVEVGANTKRIQALAAATASAPLRAYTFIGLGCAPIHQPEEHTWIAELLTHFAEIRSEVLNALSRKTSLDLYPLLGLEQWKTLAFYKGGQRLAEGCDMCPFTTSLVERLVPGGPVREVMISQLEPYGRLLPHIDNTLPMLTLHVPLVAPQPSGIRVGDEIHRWVEGQPLIIDTTFEHEAWNDSGAPRINLMIDFWPHGLSETEQMFFTEVYRRQMKPHLAG